MGGIEARLEAPWRFTARQDDLFRKLHHINLDFYPFSLHGEAYLKSRWKRAFDVSLAVLSLPFAFLPLGLAAVAMRLESPNNPVLINQERFTENNATFSMWKIRSQENNTEGTGNVNPTRIGSLLRTLSVDELPQLWNVLRGDMSLVGRRPLMEFDFKQFEEWMLVHLPYRLAQIRFGFTDDQWKEGGIAPKKVEEIREYADVMRLASTQEWEQFFNNNKGKAGLTGLYQIMGRRLLPHHHRIKLDLFYEKNASLGLDIAIVLGTISAIIHRRGAL